MTDYKVLANKVFAEICERVPHDQFVGYGPGETTEGVINSINEFIAIIVEAAEIYYTTFSVNDRDKIKLIEEFPKELFQRINNESNSLEIGMDTLRDIRVVTYLADESPATVGAHSLGQVGIRNIKPRLISVEADEKYSGYSILKYAKDIEAHVIFKVWGVSEVDIRKRSSMLRKIIESNIWYLKHKGLKDIVWTGARESDLWDKQNLVKMKSENYFIRFSEVLETREKNVEQVVIQLGLAD